MNVNQCLSTNISMYQFTMMTGITAELSIDHLLNINSHNLHNPVKVKEKKVQIDAFDILWSYCSKVVELIVQIVNRWFDVFQSISPFIVVLD